MTVLIPPRIYFTGGTSWDVATGNNNDQWSTYDFQTAALNWPYLATQKVDGVAITPSNFKALFPKWVLTMQTYVNANGDGTTTSWEQMPSEWNYWGGNTSNFLQLTTVTGGQLEFGTDPANPPVITNDPLVGSALSLLGNTTQSGPRLVDINPDAFWSSQIFLGGVAIGNPKDSSKPYLVGTVPEGLRMHSRWLNFQRNLNQDGKVEIAGVGGCVFQIGLPTANVTINNPNHGSPLLTALAAASSRANVQGVQLRFSAYLTRYWSSETILAAIPDLEECLSLPSKQPDGANFINRMLTCQYTKLLALWQRDLAAGKSGTKNGAITKVVGTVGIWDRCEPATVPWQRYLLNTNQGANPMGCASGNLCGQTVSLDLGSLIPETSSAGDKANMGDLQVGFEDRGTFSLVGTLAPSDYDKAAYERTAGIVDLAVPAGVSTQGKLAIRAQAQYIGGQSGSTDYVTAIAESDSQLSVQTDQRGVYVEQGQTGTISFDVLYSGTDKSRTQAPVSVKIAQYVPVPIPPEANGGSWQLVGSQLTGQTQPRPPVARFVGHEDPVSMVTTVALDSSGYGQGSFSYTPTAPGFPTFAFFPYFNPDHPPEIPTSVGPVAPGVTTMNAFFACGRNMPFDDDLPQKFVQLWNRTHSEDQAYEFVDQEIFAVYALIYPVMAGVVGTKQALVGNNAGIQSRTSASLQDSTAYMPVTRELSAGKRRVIEMWGQLVDNGFDPSFDF